MQHILNWGARLNGKQHTCNYYSDLLVGILLEGLCMYNAVYVSCCVEHGMLCVVLDAIYMTCYLSTLYIVYYVAFHTRMVSFMLPM